MSSPTTDHQKATSETTIASRWLLGALTMLVLLFAIDAMVWAVAGWPPALAPQHFAYAWWLEYQRMIQKVFVVVLVVLTVVACAVTPWLVGSALSAAWRRLRHEPGGR